MPMKPIKLTPKQRALINGYRDMFRNTGGNNIEELLERPDVDAFSNVVLFTLHVDVLAQLHLLERLFDAGELVIKGK